MNAREKATVEIDHDIVLDARRAILLRETQTLVVADTHFGYAWAHRHGGQLMPVPETNETLARLVALLDDLAPCELVLLGDIVHRAVPVDALKTELCNIIGVLNARVKLTLIAGNHDRNLRRLLDECGVEIPLATHQVCGRHLLVHGDAPIAETSPAGRLIVGHEHPAISISDRVATSVKCPCFLVNERVIVMPAFSSWAAGTNVRTGRLMSPLLQREIFPTAIAIIADKLLPVPLSDARQSSILRIKEHENQRRT